MHVFITGASGLIGSELTRRLRDAGHQITMLTRKPSPGADARHWDPEADELPADLLNGCDVLVHLAGESIGDGRWTSDKKRKIRVSRVRSTELLADLIRRMDRPPQAWVVASATGFYGDRGSEVLTEESPPGVGFLPEVCRAWEGAADPARDRCRVVHIRTGVVLTEKGGALQQLLLPFKLGAGGVVGSGEQYWSWISLDDIVRLFEFSIHQPELAGVVNGVSPQPVKNREFTKTLGEVLSRPTILPLPAFAARLVLGEMADALILASTRALPRVAEQQGFQYSHPDLESALRAGIS